MNKQKLLTILVIVLTALNILALTGLYSAQKAPPIHHAPEHYKGKKEADAFIKQKFNFSDKQMADFTISKDKHIEEVRTLERMLSEKSKQYYKLQKESNRDTLLSEILALNQAIYEANATHFADVYKICNDQQREELNPFIDNLVGGQKGRKGPRPPKRG